MASGPVALGDDEVGSWSTVALVDDLSLPSRSEFSLSGNPREVSGMDGEERASPAMVEGAVAMMQSPLPPSAVALVLVSDGDGDAAGHVSDGSIVVAEAVQGRSGSDAMVNGMADFSREEDGGFLAAECQANSLAADCHLISSVSGGKYHLVNSVVPPVLDVVVHSVGDSPCHTDEVNLPPALAPLMVPDVCRDDGGGMVSEEVLASLAAGEALRPSPTDGRRQPPLSSVEPVMVTERGGLMPGMGGGLSSDGGGLDNPGRGGGDEGGGLLCLMVRLPRASGFGCVSALFGRDDECLGWCVYGLCSAVWELLAVCCTVDGIALSAQMLRGSQGLGFAAGVVPLTSWQWFMSGCGVFSACLDVLAAVRSIIADFCGFMILLKALVLMCFPWGPLGFRFSCVLYLL
ncbi:hypothetical protein Dimus_005556 [Dionaea muscipula]